MAAPAKKGVGILMLARPHAGSDDDGYDSKGSDSEDGDYSPKAKADLARQFYEAGADGDFDKAGMALEKFVHLCTGE